VSADTITTNAYWDAVRDHVDSTGSLWRTPSVGSYRRYRDTRGNFDVERWHREAPSRHDHVERYSWTITDPATVAFVVEHADGRLIDPLAGSGWWARVLTDASVDVIACDINPPASSTNQWHKAGVEHFPILLADARTAAVVHSDRTLLLAWPPYDAPIGAEVVAAYGGGRVIYVGEDWGGCCGDDSLFAAFGRDWVKVAEHTPVQWDGIHDIVHVYDRRDGAL
jgi:hypothetical protein